MDNDPDRWERDEECNCWISRETAMDVPGNERPKEDRPKKKSQPREINGRFTVKTW